MISFVFRFSRKGMLPVRWMAPESLADGLFTPMSDIWSYGVLLYEMITFGSFPFQGKQKKLSIRFFLCYFDNRGFVKKSPWSYEEIGAEWTWKNSGLFSAFDQSWPYLPTWTWESEAQEVVLIVMKNWKPNLWPEKASIDSWRFQSTQDLTELGKNFSPYSGVQLRRDASK